MHAYTISPPDAHIRWITTLNKIRICPLLLDRPLSPFSNQDWTRVGLKCIPTLFTDSIGPHTPILRLLNGFSAIPHFVTNNLNWIMIYVNAILSQVESLAWPPGTILPQWRVAAIHRNPALSDSTASKSMQICLLTTRTVVLNLCIINRNNFERVVKFEKKLENA